MTDAITASPLCWPAGWPRANFPEQSQFGKGWKHPSINKGTGLILDQLRMMGIDAEDVIISTDLKLRLDGLPYSNQRTPDDPGVAIYWRDSGDNRVMAIDKYDRIGCNLWAIGKTLEALRGIDRWGGGQILDRAFTGFTALPSPEMAGGVDPYQLIGIAPEDDAETRHKAYRKALSEHHPDHGGDPAKFDAIKKAGKQIGINR